MDPISRRFRAAHRNARNLLDVFARQLRAFEHERTPSILLVRAIIDGLNRNVATCQRLQGRLG